MNEIFLVLSIVLFVGCASLEKNTKREPNQAPEVKFSEIIKKDAKSKGYCPASKKGEVCLMTWAQAVSFCKSQNAHVPTAREYLELIKPHGTVILEASEVSGTSPAGFYLVDSINPDGSRDTFYMNHSNYKRPTGQVGNHLLWTASIPPGHPEFAHVFYDEWGGGGGNPKDHLLTHLNAVQCVESGS